MAKKNNIDSLVLLKKWKQIQKKYLPKSIPERVDDIETNVMNRCQPFVEANLKAGKEYREWKKKKLKELNK